MIHGKTYNLQEPVFQELGVLDHHCHLQRGDPSSETSVGRCMRCLYTVTRCRFMDHFHKLTLLLAYFRELNDSPRSSKISKWPLQFLGFALKRGCDRGFYEGQPCMQDVHPSASLSSNTPGCRIKHVGCPRIQLSFECGARWLLVLMHHTPLTAVLPALVQA